MSGGVGWWLQKLKNNIENIWLIRILDGNLAIVFYKKCVKIIRFIMRQK